MTGSDQESYASNKARVAELERKKQRIRELNDAFRQTLSGGRIMITPGVRALGVAALSALIQAVREFDAFTPDNDPYEEHDFGSIDLGGERIFWKIDAYSKCLEYGSPDASDPKVTARVMTIMLASEY